MHMLKVERLQCNLRSLENVNNERKMLQDDNRLGVNVNNYLQPNFSGIRTRRPYTHIKIIEMNYTTN